jgi:hypothetical protein
MKDTEAFIKALSEQPQIRGSSLIISIEGNSKAGAGTYIHPHVAQWISPRGRHCSSMDIYGALEKTLGIPREFLTHTIKKNHRALCLHTSSVFEIPI